jgi:tripartite-type tricarboxylate transporter receptor subunit TctC
LTNSINTTFYRKLNFDFIHDIAPVASVTRGSYVMVVNPSVPANTVQQILPLLTSVPPKSEGAFLSLLLPIVTARQLSVASTCAGVKG